MDVKEGSGEFVKDKVETVVIAEGSLDGNLVRMSTIVRS